MINWISAQGGWGIHGWGVGCRGSGLTIFFVTNLARARVSYSFTPRIFTQALVQYNDNADIWSANLRFGWLQAANTGLFVVYNDTRGLVSSTDPHVGGQSLIVKFSRLFDLAN